jgi:hypothetical protein
VEVFVGFHRATSIRVEVKHVRVCAGQTTGVDA